MRLFSNLPLTIINVRERDYEGNYTPRIETKVVDNCHELHSDIFVNHWTPILRDRHSRVFRVAKMVALTFDSLAYSQEEAISDFNDVAHMIVKQRKNAGFTLILPLREAIRNEPEYLSVMQKVAAKCRRSVTASDLVKFLPPCCDIVAVNHRSKADISQMLLGVSGKHQNKNKRMAGVRDDECHDQISKGDL